MAEIWVEIATGASDQIANRFIAALEASFNPLLRFPLSGPAREKLAPGLRVTFHDPYAIYYMPQPGVVVIVRVVHGARDIDALAAQGAFD